jgi:hypothetical protein
MNPSGGCTPAPGGGATMLRMLGPVQKREVKATQNLSIIVLFFIICWIPLYTINCVMAFCQDCIIPLELTNFCIILSHANSAVNPLLYAYHLRDFRAALKSLLCCLFGNKGDSAGNDLQGKCIVSIFDLLQRVCYVASQVCCTLFTLRLCFIYMTCWELAVFPKPCV